MAVQICAVHLDSARQWRIIALFHQRLANLDRQHEGGLVLNAQIAAQLQSLNAFHGFGENGLCPEVNLQWKLVEGKDRPTGHVERVLAVLTLPLLASGVEVALADHTTHTGHTTSPLLPQRTSRNTANASSSLISNTLRTDRVRALAESRKCSLWVDMANQSHWFMCHLYAYIYVYPMFFTPFYFVETFICLSRELIYVLIS